MKSLPLFGKYVFRHREGLHEMARRVGGDGVGRWNIGWRQNGIRGRYIQSLQ